MSTAVKLGSRMPGRVRGGVGFTLVELSVVLVIVGLLAGGILTGRDLIDASRRRAVLGEVEQIATAAQTFQAKYDCLPGDCPDATRTWGRDCHFGEWGPTVPAATGTATCDGNGDGRVLGNSATTGFEGRYFWHHLKNAGLLNLSLTSPLLGTGHEYKTVTAGVNVPASRWGANALYEVEADAGLESRKGWGPSAGGTVWDVWMPGKYGNAVVFGSSGDLGPGSIISREQAQLIDRKVDDGSATTGEVVGSNPGTPTLCVDTITQAGAAMPYTQGVGGQGKAPACLLLFRHRF